ncbi:unnamed protein product [Prorocentrum cordatum]|uniref:Uncharacterized protein n=1 Tax=Prorocentrum cordatum TaxID=2364126 RepID=A0ABN9UDC7_9DINO|nr:unnamed protein product [Polarella glacialis]
MGPAAARRRRAAARVLACVPQWGWRPRMLKLFFFCLVGAVCGERWSSLGRWNPHSLATAHRLDEVSAVLRNVGAIGLPGTGVRSWQGEAHHAASAPYHHTAQFGWARSRLVTKAGGCAAMINKTWLAKKDLRRIVTPPFALLGRGGPAHVSSGPAAVATTVRYFPPKPSMGGSVEVYKDTCDQLLRWAKQEFLETPQRYTPVICMDLNPGLVAKANSDVVGAFGPEKETARGSAAHEWLSTVGLIAINTHYDCGHTFEGANGTSQIDYVCTPAAAAPLVSWTKMVLPIVFAPLRERWDRAKLSQAALTGEGREAFLDQLQYVLESHCASFEALESREVTTGHAALLMNMILKHFSQAPAYNELAARMTNEKWRLLTGRRTLLGDAPAAAAAADTTTTSEVAKPTVATKAHTKTLKPHRRKFLAERRRMTEEDLARAWKLRGMAASPRLSRALAGTGAGIKNRSYRANPSFSPSVSEWVLFLELPPLSGGVAGESVTVLCCAELTEERCTQLKDADEIATPDNYEVPDLALVQALMDFKMTAKASFRLSRLALQVRGTETLPLQAPLSFGFAPGKKNGKVAAWKGRHSGQPMLHKSYDATNAFACGSKDQLEERAHARLAGEEENTDADICYATAVTSTRRSRLTVIIDAADDRCAVRSGSGGFMGDASQPEFVTENYHHAVRAWSALQRMKDAAKQAKDANDKPAEAQADKDAAAASLALRELGPPTATMFCAMVEALAGEEVGRANRQTLEAWSTAMVGDPPGFVKLCRFENWYQKDMVKIVFPINDQTKENILTDSFKQLDCVVTSGTAPAGYMEDELSAWIDDSRRSNYPVYLVVDDRSDVWPRTASRL